MFFKRKEIICPICGKELTIQTISNATFNDKRICTSCIEAINDYFCGETNQDNISLEDLKNIVHDYYSFNEEFENFTAYNNLYKKYEKKLTQHFRLLEEIESLYSVAINQKCIDNKYTDKCLKLCMQDFLLAPDLATYWEKESILQKSEFILPHYSSFEKSAKLLEKLEKYNLAINVCSWALKLGYTRDGSQGGLKGRLARLLKKYNKINNTNWQYDYDENIIYDAETGETAKDFEEISFKNYKLSSKEM